MVVVEYNWLLILIDFWFGLGMLTNLGFWVRFYPHNKIEFSLESGFRCASPILAKIGGNTSRIFLSSNIVILLAMRFPSTGPEEPERVRIRKFLGQGRLCTTACLFCDSGSLESFEYSALCRGIFERKYSTRSHLRKKLSRRWRVQPKSKEYMPTSQYNDGIHEGMAYHL
jgi:hypothetical protein